MADIRITAKSREVINGLMGDNVFFKEEADIARFAFAYAIKNRLDYRNKSYKMENSENKWHHGSVDPQNEMLNLVAVLHPEETNKEKYVEYLINMGIEEIGKKMVSSKIYSIIDLLDDN